MTKPDLLKYKFFNLPRPLVKSDYQEICDLLVRQLKNHPDIKSIYLSGGPWQPGISDLDIILIFNDNLKKIANVPSPWSLSDKARFIFMHSYGKYNEQYLKDFCYMAPDRNKKECLKLLYGRPIELRYPDQELNPEDYRSLNAILMFDLLVNKLSFYPKYLMTNQVDVRVRLGWLYSLTYALEMIEIINHQKIARDFDSRIKNLRKNWFSNNREENLKELILLSEESIAVVLDVVEQLDDYLKNQNLPFDNRIIFSNRQYHITFEDNWTRERFLSAFRDGYVSLKNILSGRKLENFRLVLPSSLSYYFISYAHYQGGLSNRIRQALINYRFANIPISLAVDRHIKTINDFYQKGIDNPGLFRIFFPYGFLIKKQRLASRLGDWLIYLIRWIKDS